MRPIEKKQDREKWIRVVQEAHAYGGLRVMPDRPLSKSRQFLTLKQDIIACRNLQTILFLGASNDWISILVDRELTLRLKNNATRRWAKLSGKGRSHYRFQAYSLLHPEGERYISRKLRIYMAQLELLFSDTTATTVYHCSVLERLDWNIPHLDLLFAVLNSYLQASLKKVKVYNKFGQPIRFVFASVTSLFHEAKDQPALFPRHEILSGHAVHRTKDSYRQVFEKLHARIKRDLSS